MTSLASLPSPFFAEKATKAYPGHVALDSIDLDIPAGRVVGLLGRNGAGKTSLLHLASGLALPTSGACRTFGRPTDQLDSRELNRLGLVQQEGKFIEWMTVSQHLDFNASFYSAWDRDLQQRLIKELEVPLDRKIAVLSTGDRQKVGILLGVCHRPALLLLDEPMSSLDPLARAAMLGFLIELLRDGGSTLLISSHILSDVEKIVDWVVCLESGRLLENISFDTLQESFAEWTVTAPQGGLPAAFDEPFVLGSKGNGSFAHLSVRTGDPEAITRFGQIHRAEVQARPLSLEEMFPLLTASRRNAR
ncbi:MAG TPA: ABC transporter ATP-binding protein [Opitutaceae bacterium]|jgi:ABC-2 type transport system ATP-binding protein